MAGADVPQNGGTGTFDALNKVNKPDNYKLEIHGSQTTFNLPEAVLAAIRKSNYFKQLYELKTFNEVVDEIYTEVSYVEPWVAGKGLGTASSAFCLLYKLFLMRVSARQMHVLVTHQDSPYIRAVGFLYLRFGVSPRELVQWTAPFVDDAEEFVPRSNASSRPITMGRYVRDLLRNAKYYDLMLPRVPVAVMKDIDAQLQKYRHEVRSGGAADERASPPRRSRSPPSPHAQPQHHHRRHRSPSHRRTELNRGRSRSRSSSVGRSHARSRRRSRSPPSPGRRDRHKRRRGEREHEREHHDFSRDERGSRHISERRSPPTPKESASRRTPTNVDAQRRFEDELRSRYGASTHGGAVALQLSTPAARGASDAAYGAAGGDGRDVVLKSHVPDAVKRYQDRKAA